MFARSIGDDRCLGVLAIERKLVIDGTLETAHKSTAEKMSRIVMRPHESFTNGVVNLFHQDLVLWLKILPGRRTDRREELSFRSDAGMLLNNPQKREKRKQKKIFISRQPAKFFPLSDFPEILVFVFFSLRKVALKQEADDITCP